MIGQLTRAITSCGRGPIPCPGVNRRSVLVGAAAFATIAGMAAARAQARNLRRVDVHHHLSPPGFIKEIAARKTGQKPLEDWTPARAIEDMDKGGVATAITSISEPGVHFGDNAAARVLARECNEYAARLKMDFRGRFGNFAIVSLPDVDGSLREIDYALGTLKAEGICMLTSYQGKYLGDSLFTPVLEELNRRKAVVFIHPARADCCRNLVPNVIEPVVELPEDTARTMVNLVFSGAARRYPDIKFIFSHAGGTLPALIHRVEWWANVRKDLGDRFPDGVRSEFIKFFYDTAFSEFPSALAPLTNLVPASQILFGTDFPFYTSAETVNGLVSYGFDPGATAAIDRENAIKLMPTVA
jgi:predicted TIM-barrel fold metal-dependent hydrolase